MAKIIAIRAFDDNFAITLDSPIEGLVVTKRDALGNVLETAKGQKDTISINAKYLRMMLYNDNVKIALIRSARETSFESRHMIAFLLNAECDVEAVFHAAGEVEEDFVYEHDKYSYKLSHFVLSAPAEAMVDAAIAKMYDADSLFD